MTGNPRQTFVMGDDAHCLLCGFVGGHDAADSRHTVLVARGSNLLTPVFVRGGSHDDDGPTLGFRHQQLTDHRVRDDYKSTQLLFSNTDNYNEEGKGEEGVGEGEGRERSGRRGEGQAKDIPGGVIEAPVGSTR